MLTGVYACGTDLCNAYSTGSATARCSEGGCAAGCAALHLSYFPKGASYIHGPELDLISFPLSVPQPSQLPPEFRVSSCCTSTNLLICSLYLISFFLHSIK